MLRTWIVTPNMTIRIGPPAPPHRANSTPKVIKKQSKLEANLNWNVELGKMLMVTWTTRANFEPKCWSIEALMSACNCKLCLRRILFYIHYVCPFVHASQMWLDFLSIIWWFRPFKTCWVHIIQASQPSWPSWPAWPPDHSNHSYSKITICKKYNKIGRGQQVAKNNNWQESCP